MRRDRALKIVLVVLGLLVCAGVYPLVLMAKEERYVPQKMEFLAFLEPRSRDAISVESVVA